MKKLSNGLGVVLRFAGGVAGAYLLGAFALYADVVANNGRIFHSSPDFVKTGFFMLYSPLFMLLQEMGWIE